MELKRPGYNAAAAALVFLGGGKFKIYFLNRTLPERIEDYEISSYPACGASRGRPSLPAGADTTGRTGQESRQGAAIQHRQTKTAGRQAGFQLHPKQFDIAGNCEKAKHYDYTWFEMQHSTLEFKDIEAMIAACPHAGAIPMIRLPDAQEWHIQHSTDIGALGVIVPTVDDVDRAREAVEVVALSAGGAAQLGQRPSRQHLGHNGVNYHQHHQRQHAGGGHDRDAHRRGQRL